MSTLSNEQMAEIREGFIRQNEWLRGKVEHVNKLTTEIEKLHANLDRLDEMATTFGLRTPVQHG